jgi:hypothetical protein
MLVGTSLKASRIPIVTIYICPTRPATLSGIPSILISHSAAAPYCRGDPALASESLSWSRRRSAATQSP